MQNQCQRHKEVEEGSADCHDDHASQMICLRYRSRQQSREEFVDHRFMSFFVGLCSIRFYYLDAARRDRTFILRLCYISRICVSSSSVISGY